MTSSFNMASLRQALLNSSRASSRCNCTSKPLRILGSGTSRAFSATSPAQGRLNSKKKLKFDNRHVPPYPHGPARLYKQSNFGLYAGARPLFGYKYSKGKYVTKTLHKWSPNVRKTRLYSEALKEMISLKVTARVLRTVDKVGGLDNYVLGNTSARIKDLGMKGWQLRWKIMQSPAMQKRWEKERKELGLLDHPEYLEKLQERKDLEEKFNKTFGSVPSREERAKFFYNHRKRRDLLPDDLFETYRVALKQTLAEANRDAANPEGGMLEERLSVEGDEVAENEEGWQELDAANVNELATRETAESSSGEADFVSPELRDSLEASGYQLFDMEDAMKEKLSQVGKRPRMPLMPARHG